MWWKCGLPERAGRLITRTIVTAAYLPYEWALESVEPGALSRGHLRITWGAFEKC